MFGINIYEKRIIVFFVLLVTVVMMQSQDVKNPVWPHDWPDPTVWKAEDGQYFCVATNPRRILSSHNLFDWTTSDFSPIDDESWEKMQSISHHFWAPDVAVVNGRRLLYISLYNSAEDSKIGVLKEVSPGHFNFHGIITSSNDTGIDDTIDPEVVTDAKTGKVWLFFGSVGGIHRIELSHDGLSIKKNAKYVHVAGLSVRESPSRSNVFEGCYLHKRNGYWYMFVSSGFYGDHTYKLLVGRSKKLTGVFRSRDGNPMTKGHATPVIQSDEGDFFYGPGHCGEIFHKNGNDYIFYHCHNRNASPNHRPMMLQEIKWDKEGWPYVAGGKPQ